MIINKDTLPLESKNKVIYYEDFCRKKELGLFRKYLIFLFVLFFSCDCVSVWRLFISTTETFSSDLLTCIVCFCLTTIFSVLLIVVYFILGHKIKTMELSLVYGIVQKGSYFNSRFYERRSTCSIKVDGETFYLSMNSYLPRRLKYCFTVFAFHNELNKIQYGTPGVFLVDLNDKKIKFDMTNI